MIVELRISHHTALQSAFEFVVGELCSETTILLEF